METKKFKTALHFILSAQQPKDEELATVMRIFEACEKDVYKEALKAFKAYKSNLENPYLQYMTTPDKIAQMGLMAGIVIGMASMASEDFQRDMEKTARERAPDPNKMISFKMKQEQARLKK